MSTYRNLSYNPERLDWMKEVKSAELFFESV